jgi:hypothetical protein
MKSSRLSLLARLAPGSIAAWALTVILAACGSSSATTSTPPPISPGSPHPASATGPVKIGIDGTVTVSGDGPVSTLILIDRTTLDHQDPALADSYRTTALNMAVPTITRGGTLSVEVFGRVAAHAVSLYTTHIPTLKEEGPGARDDAGERAILTAALNVALGITPPLTKIAAQELYDVNHPFGSDLGGAVSLAITSLETDSAPIRNALILTDGFIVEQAQPPLARVLADHGVRGAAALIRSDLSIPAGTRPITMLRIAGLASTSGQIDPGAKTVNHLAQAWALATRHIPAREIAISGQS